ncbi:FecR domain-containing protein [Planctomycetota bacterium]
MCGKYGEDKILDCLMGELPSEEQRAFDAHCEECSSCRAAREELAPLAGLSGAHRVRPRPGVEASVKDAIARVSATLGKEASVRLQGHSVFGRKVFSLCSSSRLRWAAVAASLTIIVSSVAFNHYQSGRLAERIVAQIEKTSPGVLIRRHDKSVNAVIGSKLVFGDRIETEEGQNVTFSYIKEETWVKMKERTGVELGRGDKGKRMHLFRGEIEANVAPQLEGKPMAILTPHAELVVLGTAFSVTASEDTTGLNVMEGTVRMGLPGGGHWEDIEKGGVGLAKAGADRVVMPGTLVRSMRITGLPKDAGITGIAVAGKDVWVHGNHGKERSPILACLDPATGKVVREVEFEEGFRSGSGITWKDGLLWGFSRDGKSLKGVDVETGATARTIPLPPTGTSSLRIFDIHGDVAWMRGRVREELVKIDLEQGAILGRIRCPFGVDRIAASENAVYVGKSGWNVCKIDPRDGRIAYRFMCEAESITGDMSLDTGLRLWAIQGREPIVHVFEAE